MAVRATPNPGMAKRNMLPVNGRKSQGKYIFKKVLLKKMSAKTRWGLSNIPKIIPFRSLPYFGQKPMKVLSPDRTTNMGMTT